MAWPSHFTFWYSFYNIIQKTYHKNQSYAFVGSTYAGSTLYPLNAETWMIFLGTWNLIEYDHNLLFVPD
jgi:hypothetical protein